jgi:hypothetical protein
VSVRRLGLGRAGDAIYLLRVRWARFKCCWGHDVFFCCECIVARFME